MALCDVDTGRLDQAASRVGGRPKLYKDFRRLLEDKDVDAVYMRLARSLHALHTMMSCQAGKDVYCEKPAGVDVRGVLRVQKAGEQAAKDRTLFFGFQQRFSPEYLAAEKLIRGGHLGQITLMISYWIWGGSAFLAGAPPLPNPEEERIRKWGRYRATSGDILVEQDCHGIDVMNWFAQAHPVSQLGDGGRNWRSTGDNSDHVSVSFRYPGKVKGWMLGTQLPPFGLSQRAGGIFGSKASLVMTRNSMEWIEAGKERGARTISTRDHDRRGGGVSDLDPRSEEPQHDQRFLREYADRHSGTDGRRSAARDHLARDVGNRLKDYFCRANPCCLQ